MNSDTYGSNLEFLDLIFFFNKILISSFRSSLMVMFVHFIKSKADKIIHHNGRRINDGT